MAVSMSCPEINAGGTAIRLHLRQAQAYASRGLTRQGLSFSQVAEPTGRFNRQQRGRTRQEFLVTWISSFQVRDQKIMIDDFPLPASQENEYDHF